MMTPSELRQFEFKPAGRNAYKAEDVDLFLGQVLVDYEKMYRENSELVKRVSLLADKLEQYKKDEVDIKQAVLSAQKAADIIVRDAEESVADTKAEAEAILAAAKGEAQIIKSDAEKQAIADSDLLLSIARDKAEDIMNKAKEKAHGLLIAANDTANDKVGAATRTITSESLHYDMLKKEVSEFRASILAQYKAHIELISKLPELAVEEAAKIEAVPVSEPAEVSNIEKLLEEQELDESYNESETVLEFIETDDAVKITSDEENDTYEALETALQYEDDITEESHEDTEPFEESVSVDESADFEGLVEETEETPADIPVSRRFSINADDVTFDGFDSDETATDTFEDIYSENVIEEQEDDTINVENADDYEEDDDTSVSSFFESIESVDTETESETETKTKRKGFFRRKK